MYNIGMRSLRKYCYIAFVSAALLPWNATAVNHEALTARLFVQNKNTNAVERMLVQTLQSIKEGRLQQGHLPYQVLTRM